MKSILHAKPQTGFHFCHIIGQGAADQVKYRSSRIPDFRISINVLDSNLRIRTPGDQAKMFTGSTFFTSCFKIINEEYGLLLFSLKPIPFMRFQNLIYHSDKHENGFSPQGSIPDEIVGMAWIVSRETSPNLAGRSCNHLTRNWEYSPDMNILLRNLTASGAINNGMYSG